MLELIHRCLNKPISKLYLEIWCMQEVLIFPGKCTSLSYKWRYLVHICIHCLSSRKFISEHASSYQKLIVKEILMKIRKLTCRLNRFDPLPKSNSPACFPHFLYASSYHMTEIKFISHWKILCQLRLLNEPTSAPARS